MDRKAARALVATTLQGLGTFQAVWQGAPDKFGGLSPVALISSRSIDLTPDARALYEITSGITVSIYVNRTALGAEAAEDLLDDLALSVVEALHAASNLIQIDASTAGPEAGNLRDVDRNGIIYRIERIPLTVLDENEG